jgi:hypothetical protein
MSQAKLFVLDTDGTSWKPVTQAMLGGAGGGGGAGSDREMVVTTYRCKTAFTGASVGDVITATQVIDVTDTPTTVGTIWRNQTTALDLASAPSAANIEITGAVGLTDAQLRAAAVAMSSTQLPASLGAKAAAASLPVTLSTEDRVSLDRIVGLNIPAHDYISLSYTGSVVTGVVYKSGGSGGTTVATLTLAYTSGNLTSVTRS